MRDARRTAREELRSLLLGTPPDEPWTGRLELLARLLCTGRETAPKPRRRSRRSRGSRGAAAAPVAPALLAWCEDPDPRLRAALLRFSGHAGLRDRAAWLVAHLGASPPELSLAAREGLRALGPAILDVLLVEVGFGMRSKRDAVLGLVRELELDRATLRSLYERELATIRDSLIKLAALSGSGIHAVVLQAPGRAPGRVPAHGALLSGRGTRGRSHRRSSASCSPAPTRTASTPSCWRRSRRC